MASRVGIRMNLRFSLIVIAIFIAFFSLSSAQEANVCCEKTTTGLFCQNVAESQCAAGAQKSPTSCESTSFCKIGTCYSGVEGTCTESPQSVCNAKNASWSPFSPTQCNLGCCVLGDQASFVSLVRCKRLSSFIGIPVNYNSNIRTESECIQSVRNQDKGACVYEFEFEKTCKFTTRSICASGVNGTGKGEFFKDKLCTDRALGTVCAPTENTACVPGKEEVYFLDSCGNTANIYDSSKKNDLNYWNNVVAAEESCNPLTANINSKTCGNCNYIKGSICRAASSNNRPALGDNICANLNCIDAEGNQRRHGESWCVNNDAGNQNIGKSAVGSRYFKHVCENGQEVVEACADYRQEECIQDAITSPDDGYEFSQAACRVNRWQDCNAQTEKADCENTDRRDCFWKTGIAPGSPGTGVCMPKNPPGLKFWAGEETKKICGAGSTTCEVTFESSLTGGSKCVENCECLEQSWINARKQMCTSLGDCGPNINWLGDAGRNESTGFKVSRSGFEASKYPTN